MGLLFRMRYAATSLARLASYCTCSMLEPSPGRCGPEERKSFLSRDKVQARVSYTTEIWTTVYLVVVVVVPLNSYVPKVYLNQSKDNQIMNKCSRTLYQSCGAA